VGGCAEQRFVHNTGHKQLAIAKHTNRKYQQLTFHCQPKQHDAAEQLTVEYFAVKLVSIQLFAIRQFNPEHFAVRHLPVKHVAVQLFTLQSDA